MSVGYVWHGGQHPPVDLPITQVCKYVFDDLGRVIVHYIKDPRVWNFLGVH